MTTTLVLGGARSGKSRHAENLLRDHDQVIYVATAAAFDDTDASWAERVSRHRDRRSDRWQTIETLDLAETLNTATDAVLVDCLGVWLTRVADRIGWDNPKLAEGLATQRSALVAAWRAARVDVVAVTNEVGLGVVPATESGRMFRDELGLLNAQLSSTADRVHLVVAGRILDLSGMPVVP